MAISPFLFFAAAYPSFLGFARKKAPTINAVVNTMTRFCAEKISLMAEISLQGRRIVRTPELLPLLEANGDEVQSIDR